MMRPRAELIRGLLVLLGFFGLILVSDIFLSERYTTSDYISVEPESLVNNAEHFEGKLISTIVRVSEVHNHSADFYFVKRNVLFYLLTDAICPTKDINR